MKLWGGAFLAFLATCGALALYSATGAGDCADCPKTFGQHVARVLLPLATLSWIGLLLGCAVSARNVGEAILAVALLLFAVFTGLALLWILTSN